MSKWITVTLLAIAVSGCENLGEIKPSEFLDQIEPPEFFSPIESLTDIEIGMTKSQVLELAGAPTIRHVQYDREAWEYCVAGWFVDDYTLVWFDGAQVVETEVSEDYEFGRCGEFFDAFGWENAPPS